MGNKRSFLQGFIVPHDATKTAGEDGEDSRRIVSVVVSSGNADRAGDIIRQEGVSLKNYISNPVVLFGHDHGNPVATAENVKMAENQITADAVFPDAGAVAESDRVFNLIQSGIIRAVSIGIIATEMEWLPDYSGLDFIKSEMIEFSFVSVPANPDALIIAADLEKEQQKELATMQRRIARLERNIDILVRATT